MTQLGFSWDAVRLFPERELSVGAEPQGRAKGYLSIYPGRRRLGMGAGSGGAGGMMQSKYSQLRAFCCERMERTH